MKARDTLLVTIEMAPILRPIIVNRAVALTYALSIEPGLGLHASQR